jgi:hypothetical protein
MRAGIHTVKPKRERFVYRPEPVMEAVIYASQLELRLEDPREEAVRDAPGRPVLGLPQDGEELDVSLHGSFAEDANARLRSVVSGRGPKAFLIVRVREAIVRRDGYYRRVRVTLELAVGASGLEPLSFAPESVVMGLRGAPHDLDELDSVHRAASIAILDHFFANPLVVVRVNEQLAKPNPMQPQNVMRRCPTCPV